jgi:hypothetical protein
MAISSWSTHQKGWFSIVMLVYQRVYPIDIPLNHYNLMKIPLKPLKSQWYNDSTKKHFFASHAVSRPPILFIPRTGPGRPWALPASGSHFRRGFSSSSHVKCPFLGHKKRTIYMMMTNEYECDRHHLIFIFIVIHPIRNGRERIHSTINHQQW